MKRMLTLSGFETQIEPAILERGRQYFASGNVTELEEAGNHKWEATVEGSETYLVEITLDGTDDITDVFCDCPYDGEVCKHVAAVLFLLRKTMSTKKKEPKKKSKNIFENLLQTLSNSELQDFIRSYAARNKNFTNEFELFFADKDSRIDVEKKYSDMLQKLIKKHTSGGYIGYRESLSLSREISKLLAAGYTYFSQNNFKDAFSSGKAILTSLMEITDEADDSAGSIGNSIDKTIDFLKLISESREAAIQIREQVYHFLQTELAKDIYFQYDYGYSLFDMFCSLAVQLNKDNEFTAFINQQVAKLDREHQGSRKEYYQTSLISFLQQTGKAEEAKALIRQSLHIVEVRQAEVDKATNRKDFGAAKTLVRDGIRIAEEANNKSDIIYWQQQLLQIATAESDINTIRLYARQFAFYRGFHSSYYQQWKATYTPGDWKPVIEKWIADTVYRVTAEWNNTRFWRAPLPPLLQALAPVYMQENMTDRLLTLVQQENDLTTTLQYHDALVKKYPDELLGIYLPALEAYALKADNRTQYADLVSKMKRIMTGIPAGKEKILSLAQTLKDLYSSKPRRPAMIEELNKILY